MLVVLWISLQVSITSMNQLNIVATETAQISNDAPLSGAAFTGAITVNGATPPNSIPSTVALLAGATFTGAVTVAGLSLGNNNLNFKISNTAFTALQLPC